MRHNRRAVMKERYKLYMRKNVLNGRYFVRNMQILACMIIVSLVVVGGIVLGCNTPKKNSVTANAKVSVKEALFGNSEEEKVVVSNKEATTEKNTEQVTATEATTTETIVAKVETSDEVVTEPETKSEFDNKCIANVEETLNIRKEPSAEAEFVGSMNPGAIAIVEGNEGEWTKIKSGDVEGYVLSQFVLTGESAEEFAKDYVTLCGTVLEDGVNIRTEMSTESDILTVLDKDDTITVLDTNEDADVDSTEDVESTELNETSDDASVKTEQADEDITWLPVMLEDGQTGYVAADFIDVDRLYEIAVSAEELERQAAEEAARIAAEEEAARQAAEAAANQTQSNNNTSSNSNNDDYKGATTTPVTTTESGDCIGTFTITAYCGCKKCSGGHSKTATGTTPTEGRTIAADTSVLPFGTQVVIGGVVYTVEDCGSGVNGNHIDIFFATHEKAMAFGRKTMKVYRY